MNKQLSKLYAQPLLKRKENNSLTSSDVCKEYFNILKDLKDVKYQEEAHIWLLLSYLHDKKLEIPDFYKSIITKNQRFEQYVRFFLWLCKIYDFTRKGKKQSYTLFEYFRSGQNDKFLEEIQNSEKNEEWKTLTFSGALSSAHFKSWSETVYSIAERKKETEHLDLYLSLAGDKEANEKHEQNVFDKMWTSLYNIFTLAKCDKTYFFKFPELIPENQNQFESMAICVFKNISNEIEALQSEESYPLIFRVNASLAFNKIPVSLLQTYIIQLHSNDLLGLIIFYSSLADPENSLFLLTDILASFEPSQTLVDTLNSFGIDIEKLVCRIVERIAQSTIEDFECEIDQGEITEMKIKCLTWFSLIDSLKPRTLANVRKILSSLVFQDEYNGANSVFNQFAKLFHNEKEKASWQILIFGELEYANWVKNEKSIQDKACIDNLSCILSNIICFPDGWMVDCNEVDKKVGCHFIPLVVEQLFDVYMTNKQPEQALGIYPKVFSSLEYIKQYFDTENWMHFLLLAKDAAKCCYNK